MSAVSSSDARAIFEAHMDACWKAAREGDFAGVRATFAIPCQIVLADSEMIVTSEDELRAALEHYAGRLAAEGVVEELNWCTEAELVAGKRGIIVGDHMTEWRLADGRPPIRYATQVVLAAYPTGWKLLWLRSELGMHDLEVLDPEFIAQQARQLAEMGAH